MWFSAGERSRRVCTTASLSHPQEMPESALVAPHVVSGGFSLKQML